MTVLLIVTEVTALALKSRNVTNPATFLQHLQAGCLLVDTAHSQRLSVCQIDSGAAPLLPSVSSFCNINKLLLCMLDCLLILCSVFIGNIAAGLRGVCSRRDGQRGRPTVVVVGHAAVTRSRARKDHTPVCIVPVAVGTCTCRRRG